ncbi:MAG: adenylate/guanylate cyclase domain-containing protein [Proteobacteria bacterium]|nr:adenylate/guanylate cyclase domain-containing protein [Pseudomonadota bacterium]MDA1058239.1 adenylate/guanylate cyclase domain-containing protein [Pseudomonadota bacterium]
MTTTTVNTPVPALAPATPVAKHDPVDTAFGREELYARRLSLRVRTILVIAVLAFLPFVVNPPEVLPYFYGLSLFFVLSAWLHYRITKAGNRSIAWSYLFATFDVVLITWILLVPVPYIEPFLPPGAQLWFGGSAYMFIFIATAAFTYAPGVVVWTGIAAAAAWWVGVLWILQSPETFTFNDVAAITAMTVDQRNDVMADFRRVDLGIQAQTSFLFVIVAAALAAFVWRVRKLVYDSATAERARGNLARFFSPNIVAELSTHDEPLRAGRRQDIAIMFSDIVGFTELAEDRSPDDVLALLREVHGIAARQVFAHHGTLDKYLGDGVMATFGTPTTADDDADRALACAKAILRDLAQFNAQQSGPAVRLGIGLHYGDVVLGDIGSDERLEYTVIGDTVNVASRLERLTRQIGADLVISDALCQHLRDPGLADGLVRGEPAQLRGREEPVAFWSFSTA